MNFRYTSCEKKFKRHESMLVLTLHLLEHVLSQLSCCELNDCGVYFVKSTQEV